MINQEQRQQQTTILNRVRFEQSFNNTILDVNKYLPYSHLMSTMMKHDRDWLEENFPEIVLIHIGTPYYTKPKLDNDYGVVMAAI